MQQQQLLAPPFPPPVMPGLPQPPVSVNGVGAANNAGVPSLSGNLMSMQAGAPPNPFVPPITSIGSHQSTGGNITPSAGGFLGPPSSASPGFPGSQLAQSQNAMAAAMAAMAAAGIPMPPVSSAAFGFPGTQVPVSAPSAVPNNLMPSMMNPAALSALMTDKTLDDKQVCYSVAFIPFIFLPHSLRILNYSGLVDMWPFSPSSHSQPYFLPHSAAPLIASATLPPKPFL